MDIIQSVQLSFARPVGPTTPARSSVIMFVAADGPLAIAGDDSGTHRGQCRDCENHLHHPSVLRIVTHQPRMLFHGHEGDQGCGCESDLRFRKYQVGAVGPLAPEKLSPSYGGAFGPPARGGDAPPLGASLKEARRFSLTADRCLHAIWRPSIQARQDKAGFNRLRQRLQQVAQEVVHLVEPSMSDKPVVRGSGDEFKRKCGGRNCGCGTGNAHVNLALGTTLRGRKRLKLIPKKQRAEIKAKVERHRELHKSGQDWSSCWGR